MKALPFKTFPFDFEGLAKESWIEVLTQVARAYRNVFGRTLPITEELGELHACARWGFDRTAKGTKGYDAKDKNGRRVQIKARAPATPNKTVPPTGRIGKFVSWDFDCAVLVIMDSEYDVQEMWQAERSDLEPLQAVLKNPRHGLALSTYKSVAKRIV